MNPRPAHIRVRLLSRILAPGLAALAVQGSAAVPERAAGVGVAHTSVSSVAAIGGSGARDAPLRALDSLRNHGWQRLREAGSGGEHGQQPEVLAGLVRLPPVPGGWALLLSGLAGVWTIGRRRLSSMGNGRIAQHRSRRE